MIETLPVDDNLSRSKMSTPLSSFLSNSQTRYGTDTGTHPNRGESFGRHKRVETRYTCIIQQPDPPVLGPLHTPSMGRVGEGCRSYWKLLHTAMKCL